MFKRFHAWLDEDAPANAAGLGGVAAIGEPPGTHFGEPGVDNRPLKKKKKLVSPVLPPLTEHVGDWKENGFFHNKCSVCGTEVSGHPDSGQQSLAYCGDCDKPTCANCRDESSAQRCKTCNAKKVQSRRNLQLPKVKGFRAEAVDVLGREMMEREPTGPTVMLSKGTRVWKKGNYPVKGEFITLEKPTRVKQYAGTYPSQNGLNRRGVMGDFDIQFNESTVSDVDHEDVERAAKAVHDRWMAHQKKLGHTEHKSPDGKEDYMVPYEDLSKPAKDLDRVAVKAVLGALKEAFVVDPAGIAASLEKAGKDDAARKAKRGAILDKKPDGTVLKARRQEWTKQTLDGGEIFWIGSKKGVLTSSQLATELGTKLEEERDTFAGAPVFGVDMDAIMKTKNPKNRYHRYARYVGTDEVGETIRKHGRKQRGGEMVLQDKASGVMTYLRRKAPVG